MENALQNLSFSISAVFPTFALVFLGHIAMRTGVVNRAFTAKLSSICFTYFLSVRIFLDISETGLISLKNVRLPGFALLATLAFYALLWLFAKRFVRPREDEGTFVHVGFRSSFTVLGLSMIRSIAGEAGVAQCTGLLTTVVILYNILAVFCFVGGGPKSAGRWETIKHTLVQIAKNPLILAVAAAVLSELLGWRLPPLLRSPVESLGNVAVPLSLLCVGASLDMERLRYCWKNTILSALVKTLFQAVLVVPVAVFCGFRGIELAAIAILFTSANPSACYVMTESMGGNSDLAAASVVLSTILSVFTVTLALYLLSIFQLL